MMALTDPAIHTVVCMTSAQVGKTEILLNLIGYHVHQDPSPMLMVQPTLDMGQAFSKDRLRPMLRDSPCFRELGLTDARQRDSGDTILHKVFPGGHITISGANSAASLASRPVRLVLMDEVDRYPPSAGNEGDPVRLAMKRANNFWNRKFVLVSTPTLKGMSRIEHAYSNSDQRRYCPQCAKCGHREPWDQWALVTWDKDAAGKHLPKTAGITCSKCSHRHSDVQRQRQIKLASHLPDYGWMGTSDTVGVAGFHLNELVSPWRDLGSIVQDFLVAKRNPEQLKTFVNTVLGETYEVSGEEMEPQVLAARREPYDNAPAGVLMVTAGIDVQDDRIEMEVVGWGDGHESWGLEYIRLIGNPGLPELWERLDDNLRRIWVREDGHKLIVSAAIVDSGGHYTTDVYKFTTPRFNRHVHAGKGRAGHGMPIVSKLTRAAAPRGKSGKDPLVIIGVDTAKERLLLSWLRLTKPGPGYCHFPHTYDDTYFEQLTAEKQITRYHKGFPIREWVKARNRNEGLDCRIYALAAIELMNPNFVLLRQRQQGADTAHAAATPPPQQRWIQPDQQQGWMGGAVDGDDNERPF